MPVTALNLAWMLTALAAVVVMLTRSRLIATEKQSGVTETPHGLLNAHTVIGVLALIAWVLWLVGAAQWVGMVAIVLWWCWPLSSTGRQQPRPDGVLEPGVPRRSRRRGHARRLERSPPLWP